MTDNILITKGEYKRLKKYGHCVGNKQDSNETVSINKKYVEDDFKLFGKW